MVGLIPACAGKTDACFTFGGVCRAHPRVCGENAIQVITTAAAQRLIPACAGKTSYSNIEQDWLRAHPRVCGENQVIPALTTSAPGSSPRVRGKRWTDRYDFLRYRLIPACAGKTLPYGKGALKPRAHPRVCGENFRLSVIVRGKTGSSPRVRGKLVCSSVNVLKLRLIPACAGKTYVNSD